MKLNKHILLLSILFGSSNITHTATPADSLADAACFTAGAFITLPVLLKAINIPSHNVAILLLPCIATSVHMGLTSGAQYLRSNNGYATAASVVASSAIAGALGALWYREKSITYGKNAYRTDCAGLSLAALAALGGGYATWALARSSIPQWLARTNAYILSTKI